MKKQFLRVKQIADQTFLRAEKTEVLNEDLINAEKRVDQIKQTCQSIGKKMAACLGTETVSVEKKLKKMPDKILAQIMEESRNQLSENSILGAILGDCADVQVLLAKELVNYEVSVEKNILSPIFQVLENEIPNITKLRKQLAKLTLDMDATRTRYQTAAKHSLSSSVTTATAKADCLKDELEDASMKVEQCRDSLAAEMFALISREPEFAQLIIEWYRLQANYHRAVLGILDSALPSFENIIKDFPQKPVFGCSLEEHLRISDRQIAWVIESCVGFLLEFGISEEGLFRIAGSSSKMKKLKNAFDAGVVDMAEYIRDPHAVAGVLKSYLRELPEPLMTFALYDEWMAAAKITEQESRLQALHLVVSKLPEQYFNNLKYVVKFLAVLATNAEINKMSPQNIAIVMAPNLIWLPKEDSSMQFSANMSVANTHSSILNALVTHADRFFPGEIEFAVASTVFHNPQEPHLMENGDLESDTGVETHSPKSLPHQFKKPAPIVPAVQVREKIQVDRSSSFGSSHRMSASMIEGNSVVVENNKFDHKLNKGEKMFSTLPHKIIDKQERYSIHRSHDGSDKIPLGINKLEKPEIPEKPLSYSTGSLDRHRRIERPDRPPPAAPRLSKMIEKPISENSVLSENGINNDRPTIPSEKPPKPAKPVLPLIAENHQD
ncbi:rho GTPase-activating protein 44-like isoform X2 [Centruroides vittatus]|uniref:rho GTPase-activating protein 44-like isoform X2 n=1 Tax=Centruroides vittatus TaxID=120091 RepID=UPI00350FDC0A